MQTAGLKDPAAVVQVFTPVWPDMVMARTTMAYTISNTEARLAFGMIRTVAENAGMTKVYTTSATENPESLHDFRYGKPRKSARLPLREDTTKVYTTSATKAWRALMPW